MVAAVVVLGTKTVYDQQQHKSGMYGYVTSYDVVLVLPPGTSLYCTCSFVLLAISYSRAVLL